MTNYERIQSLSIEQMANEIKAVANWDRKEKVKAERDEQFYINYLSAEAPDDKCKQMDTDYCRNECPLCRLGAEEIKSQRVSVDNLNSKFTKKDLKDYSKRYRSN